MNPISLIFFITLACAEPNTSPNPLLGTWKSDNALTMDFARKNVKLEKKTEASLNSLMGQMTMSFTNGEVRLVFPDIQVSLPSGTQLIEGTTILKRFRVLYASEKVVVVSAVDPVDGETSVATYHFETPKIMWVYTGGLYSAAPDSHLREYFRRQKAE